MCTEFDLLALVTLYWLSTAFEWKVEHGVRIVGNAQISAMTVDLKVLFSGTVCQQLQGSSSVD